MVRAKCSSILQKYSICIQRNLLPPILSCPRVVSFCVFQIVRQRLTLEHFRSNHHYLRRILSMSARIHFKRIGTKLSIRSKLASSGCAEELFFQGFTLKFRLYERLRQHGATLHCQPIGYGTCAICSPRIRDLAKVIMINLRKISVDPSY